MLPRLRRSRPRRFAGPLALAGALGALFSAGAAHAQVSILSNVQSTNGTLFSYSYSVTNPSTSGTDFPIITLAAPPFAGGVTNLVAPTGFQISFDPGTSAGGLVSFLEDTQTFSSTPAVFSFDSAFAPTVSQYQAVGFDSSGNGIMSGGSVLTPVPEASTLVSLGAGLVMLTFVAARRRRSAVSTIHA